jgi:ABC-2 type transport system permease protein
MTIIIKEFIQVRRDPISLRIPIFMPVIMMFLFGYAVKTEVENIPTIIFDKSKTQISRDYIDSFTASNYFFVKYNVENEKDLADLIDRGDARAALIIPENFEKDILKNKTPQVQLIIDGTDPTTARTALNSGIIISEIYSRNYKNNLLKKIGASAPRMGGVSLNTKVWYNPNLDSNRFTIPGLVGLIVQNITIMLTAFALVREKERGTIEQLIVTPVRPVELILGKLIPYIVIGYVGFLFSLGICVFWFKVSISGNVFLLLILGLLFVICALSIGMLVSTFAQNQMQAMFVIIVIILPSLLLSGFIFPRAAMPLFIKLLGSAIPLTYFLDIIRGIVLKGVSIDFLYMDIIALVVFVSIILFIAVKRFKKSLD